MQIPKRHWLSLLAVTFCLVLATGCSKASKIQRVLKAAENDYQARNYEKAEQEYLSVFRLSPNNPTGIRQLGLIYFEEGRPRGAFQLLKKSNELDKEDHLVQLKLAELYAADGRASNAIPLLASVLKADPGNEHALLLMSQFAPANALGGLREQLETQIREGGPGLAGCHVALGSIDLRMEKVSEAEAEFQKAITLDPKLPSPYVGMMDVCSLNGDTNRFQQALQKASELSPPNSSIRLRYADFQAHTGHEKQAKEILLDVTRQAPDYIPAWLVLMKLSYAMHEYEDCKNAIDKILAVDSIPPNREALIQLGVLALAQNDPAKAVSAFQRLEAAEKQYFGKTTPEVKYYLAEAHSRNHEKQKQLADLNEALALDHDYAPAALMLADLDDKAEKYADAITLLKRLIDKYPQDLMDSSKSLAARQELPAVYSAQLKLADVYMDQKRPETALNVYKEMMTNRIMGSFTNSPEIPLRVGQVFERTRFLALAHDWYEKSLKLSPGYLPALQKITALDISRTNFTQAQERLAKVLEANPKSPDLFVLQGHIYSAQGQTNQAESAYAKAIELNPDLADAYLSLAQLYLDTHQQERALERLAPLVAKTNFSAMLQVGVIEQTSGQYEQARDSYEKILAYTNALPALNNLAYIYSEYLGNVDKALQFAERAREISPADPATADTLGWIYFKKRQYSRALTLIQESAEKQPEDPEVQMHLGMAYYMMEEEKPALASLQRAVESKVEFPDKDLAVRHLEVLKIDPSKATAETAQKLETLMQQYPDDPVLLSRLASVQEQQGEMQKAVDSLQKLISINHENWPAMMRLARIQADHFKDLRKALELAKSAHELAPNDGAASALLGELVYRTGDYQWSKSLLEDAAVQLPDDPSVAYDLALVEYAVGHVAAADTAMEKAVQAGHALPGIEKARQFLAMRKAVQDANAAQASSALVQQILAREPNDVPALMVSALISKSRGASKEAEKDWQKVLSIYPLFAPAMRELAMMYGQSQSAEDQDKAYDLGQKAMASLPDDVELARTMGVLAYNHHDWHRSLFLLRESAEKYTNDSLVLYYMGMDYEKLKKWTECTNALQQALALGLADNLAGQARTVLGEMK